MLPTTTSISGKASFTWRSTFTTPAEWPWAVSITMASTPALTNACALHRVGSHAYAGSHAQASARILQAWGLSLGLGDVLVGNEAYGVCRRRRPPAASLSCGFGGCRQPFSRSVPKEVTEVLAGSSPRRWSGRCRARSAGRGWLRCQWAPLGVDHGYAADVVFGHHSRASPANRAAGDGHRSRESCVLGTLHPVHLARSAIDMFYEFTPALLRAIAMASFRFFR